MSLSVNSKILPRHKIQDKKTLDFMKFNPQLASLNFPSRHSQTKKTIASKISTPPANLQQHFSQNNFYGYSSQSKQISNLIRDRYESYISKKQNDKSQYVKSNNSNNANGQNVFRVKAAIIKEFPPHDIKKSQKPDNDIFKQTYISCCIGARTSSPEKIRRYLKNAETVLDSRQIKYQNFNRQIMNDEQSDIIPRITSSFIPSQSNIKFSQFSRVRKEGFNKTANANSKLKVKNSTIYERLLKRAQKQRRKHYSGSPYKHQRNLYEKLQKTNCNISINNKPEENTLDFKKIKQDKQKLEQQQNHRNIVEYYKTKYEKNNKIIQKKQREATQFNASIQPW